MDEIEAAVAQAAFAIESTTDELVAHANSIADRDAGLAGELVTVLDVLRWGADRLAAVASAWHAVDRADARALVVGYDGQTIISLAEGTDAIARFVQAADGEWLASSDLRELVLSDPELGPTIRTACEQGLTRWWNPRLLAGNVVGWWSKSWTEGTNPHLHDFERTGRPGGPYRYRVRPPSD